MARKDRLTRVAVGIGSAMGKADRKAHQVAKAGLMAKEELEAIAKQVEGLKTVEGGAAVGKRGRAARWRGLLRKICGAPR